MTLKPETNEKSSKDDRTDEPGESSYRYVIEALLFLTYAAFGMTWASCGTFLKEIMKDLSLTLSQASFISTSVSFAKIFGPALAGYIACRLGLYRSFLVAACLICLGILAPMSPNYPLLLLSRFGMGIGGAMVVVYFTPMVMQWFKDKERIIINGINFVSINTGMMLSLFLTQPIMQIMKGSWKNTLILYSCISILFAILWLFLGREAKDTAKNKKEDPADEKISYFDIIREPDVWKLALTYFGALTLYLVLFTYFPTFYRDAFNLKAGSLPLQAPAIAMCIGIPASLLGIYLSKKTGLRIPFIRYAGVFLIPSSVGMYIINNPAVIIISSFLTGFCLFLWASPFFTMPQELPGMSHRKSGMLMGVFWSVCYMAATFNVWFVGKLAEMTGSFLYGFIYVTALSSFVMIGSFLLGETGPGKKS